MTDSLLNPTVSPGPNQTGHPAENEFVVDGVSVFYGDRLAVDAVSAVLPAGKITAVIGPNGCGKST
ncbi:MAG: cobalamin/Fe(3+)-siderophore ABC transporter ATP-binding protein, partial [Cryobacterium sp.]